MDHQAVLDVLNGLEVVESQGGDDAYVLVDNSPENRAKLNAVEITDDQIIQYGDAETFCILAMAFDLGIADEYTGSKLIKWGSIDDEFRQRVMDGKGTATDAIRLLQVLEPHLFVRQMETVKLHDLEPNAYINYNGNIIGKKEAEAMISAGLQPALFTVSDEAILESLLDTSRRLKNKEDISVEYSAPDPLARRIVY